MGPLFFRLSFVLSLFGALSLWSGPLTAQELRFDLGDASDSLSDDLRAASSLRQGLGAEDVTPQDLVAAAQADYGRLVSALYAQGFYSATVSIRIDGQEADRISPFADINAINEMVVTVRPGPRFRFEAPAIGPLAPGTALPEAFADGQTARSGVISDTARAAINGWRDQGFALAAIDNDRFVARHESARLAVTMAVDPGPRLSFGALEVAGNSAVRTERIVAMAGLPTGDVFSPSDLALVEARLRRVPALASVRLVEATAPGPGETLGITAEVVEQTPRRIGFGAELSSTEGLGLSTYWLHRNLAGGAETLRFEAEVNGLNDGLEGTDLTFGALFGRSATFGPDNDLALFLSVENLSEPGFSARQVDVGAELTRRVGFDAEATAGIVFQTAEVRDDLGSRAYSLLSFPIGGTLDRRDVPLNPSAGFFADAEVRPFTGQGDIDSGLRLAGDGRYYQAIGPQDRPFVLALRVQGGSVLGAAIDRAPVDALFFSGGGGTVRGQPYQSLGVDLGGGEFSGGRGFLALSAEARIPVGERLSGAIFFDTGYVGEEALPDPSGTWHSGTGAGVRYDTGIGPIRLDIATPADGPDAFGAVEMYIGIGQAF